MPLILAIEPERRQAAQLTNVVHGLGADLILVDTTERALEAIGSQVPDLVLVPALLSPQDDAALAGALRVIATAARVQMLTTPVLEAPSRPAVRPSRMLAALRRDRAQPPASVGCDPKVFADQILSYLERAAEERAAAAADLVGDTVVVEAVAAEDVEEVLAEAVVAEEVVAEEVVAEPAAIELAVPEPVVEEAAILEEPVVLDASAEAQEPPSIGADEPDEPWMSWRRDVYRTPWPEMEGSSSEPVRPPATTEREWVALIESLRDDVERLRAERRPLEAIQAAPAPARPPRAPAQRSRPDRKPRPVQDEWGFFDPEQCGFPALLAKLKEIERAGGTTKDAA